MKQTLVITSGYFNPIHSGHISYLEEAKKLGDKLLVIVNNDEQVKIKGSKIFMDVVKRLSIVEALRCVDHAVVSTSPDGSVCSDLVESGLLHGDDFNLVFAKGGDRTIDNIPEVPVCNKFNIKMVFGVGCDKVQSSSNMLKLYNNEET